MGRKTVEEAIKKLRAAWTGREVRDRMADTIEAMNEEVTNTSSKQSILEETFNHLIINEGNSNAEVVAARVDQKGNSYDTLGKRMNNFDSQLEQKTNENSIYRLKKSKVEFNGINLKDMRFFVKNIQRPDFEDCKKIYTDIKFNSDLFEDIPENGWANGGTNYFVYPGDLDHFKDKIYRKGYQSVNNGILTIRGNEAGGGNFEDFYCPIYNNYLPHQFIELEINGYDISGDGLKRANPEIILYKDKKNILQIICHLETYGETKKGMMEVWYKSSALLRPQDTSEFDFEQKFKIGVMMMDNHIILFRKNASSSQWNFVTSVHIDYEFYTEDMTRYIWGFGAYMDEECSLSISSFKTYMMTGLGLRDMTLVHYKDGSPYVKDGRYYFTATSGATCIHSSGAVICSYSPDEFDIKLEAYVYSKYDGGIWPDSQFDVVIDDDTNEVWYYFSTMASISTRYSDSNFVDGGPWRQSKTCIGKTVDTDFSGVIIVDTKIVEQDLNTGYDNYTIYDNANNKWLRVSTSYDYNNISIHIADTPDGYWNLKVNRGGFDLTEGPKLAKVNNIWYVLIPYQRREWKVLNISTLEDEFIINSDIMPGHQGPHCMIVPICKNNKTKYQLISMDGAHAYGLDFSWGGVWFYESDRIAQGYEFDIKSAY